MNEDLYEALNTLLDVQKESGINAKRDILLSHKHCGTLKDILYFVFNPYIRTGIGYSKLNKSVENKDYFNDETTIQSTFTYLMNNNTGRDIDIARIKGFIERFSFSKDYTTLLEQIYTKSLKLGISTTTINKIWSSFIPGFGVQLACKWQDNIDYLQNKEIFVTEKLDGNRCFANVDNGNVIFYSRSGREITGMDDVKTDLSKLQDGWYDGELLAKSFTDTQSILRTKGNKKNLVFNIFDYVTDKDVENQEGSMEYTKRRKILNDQLLNVNYDNIRLIPLIYTGKFDENIILKYLDQYTSQGSEGLMINLNTSYKFNRTCDLLKVKKMGTIDLPIIGVQEGRGEFSGTCGSLIVNYKGYPVGVGSGLSQYDRTYFWNNRENIIDRIIEIRYFEETKDQFGNLSLRFPVFVRLREEGKEVSYN